ncbi:MAG: hypothetical protein QME72_08295 [Rhodococcus sp. (in: high G+C Gram-positive bacteria)]|nr:hypothetical protein [Rhodococcus sp. (in: high G+C Gram-positive bacteria)]MDI6627704.1 hypothetical protein [Rhodococcus sp. (in: high G+C Gram-positive bacteria)]
MSNRRSRSRKTSRKAYIQAPREREALFWPTILLQFSEWLIENSWATDQLTALAAAMTIDRSARERDEIRRAGFRQCRRADVAQRSVAAHVAKRCRSETQPDFMAMVNYRLRRTGRAS